MTLKQLESFDRAAGERIHEEEEKRMAAFDAGLCSYAAARSGGIAYERDIAESALELREATAIPEPIAAAVNGWLSSQRVPRMAAIGNGLFVRVGTGRKRRAA